MQRFVLAVVTDDDVLSWRGRESSLFFFRDLVMFLALNPERTGAGPYEFGKEFGLSM